MVKQGVSITLRPGRRLYDDRLQWGHQSGHNDYRTWHVLAVHFQFVAVLFFKVSLLSVSGGYMFFK